VDRAAHFHRRTIAGALARILLTGENLGAGRGERRGGWVNPLGVGDEDVTVFVTRGHCMTYPMPRMGCGRIDGASGCNPCASCPIRPVSSGQSRFPTQSLGRGHASSRSGRCATTAPQALSELCHHRYYSGGSPRGGSAASMVVECSESTYSVTYFWPSANRY
jgi:hypothetical protein